jgi:hypothetical protein
MNVDTRYSVGMPSILCVSISVRQTSAACDVSLCSSLVRSVGSAGSAETVSAKVKMRNSVNVVCILCVSLSIRQITTALQLSSCSSCSAVRSTSDWLSGDQYVSETCD